MKSVQTLIDEARALCSPPSEAALARVLGASRGNVNDWKLGKRPTPAWAYKALAKMVDGEAAAKEWVYEFVDRSAEKLSARFSALLRRGMAYKSRTCVLA